MTSRFVSRGVIAGDKHPELTPEQQQHASTSAATPTATPTFIPGSSSAASPSRAEVTLAVAQKAQWGGVETDRERGGGEAVAARQNAKVVEWEDVQRDLEAERRRREEARRAQVEGSGARENRSLFDILQANKAAKQAAFEEQNRIRNQFRALDDDEIDFLDGVRDGVRSEEERVRRETEDRLRGFREAQKSGRLSAAGAGDAEADTAGGGDEVEDGVGQDGDVEAVAVAWTASGKKRKRNEKERDKGVRGGIIKGVKRRASENEKDGEAASGLGTHVKDTGTMDSTVASTDVGSKVATAGQARRPPAAAAAATSRTGERIHKPKLGLVDYGSDEDEDEDD
ncbi:hypothetical protein GGR54DRAFT_83131 [Hypoxylon sp. NC1633]|nr:hypothetical protein GGR54DRAFT_83131 [Hypoxylon sp. NC1633]